MKEDPFLRLKDMAHYAFKEILNFSFDSGIHTAPS